MKTARLDLGDDAGDVYIEIIEPVRATRGEAVAPAAAGPTRGERVTSEVFARAIQAVGSRFRQDLVALADPDELTLQFGASLQGGTAVLLSAQGTFNVTLKWVKKPQSA